MLDKNAIETLATLFSVLSGIVFVILAIIKARPETKKVEAESEETEAAAREHDANAAEKALMTTERATQQLYATMKDLTDERQKRRELQKTVNDLQDQLDMQGKDFEKKLAAQKMEYEKIKSDLEYTVARQAHKIEMLILQIQHLGNTPIENK